MTTSPDRPLHEQFAALRADLATLRAEHASLRAEHAALRGRVAGRARRRRARHLVPLALVALLVALVPLGLLAASPFGDLNAGSVHNANIELIREAGITRGCDPDVAYCPNGLVTREEMASFLARTAGLGSNPPVVNAKTAQTAVNAQTATTATNATNATNAAHATTADAATLATTATNATNAAHAATADAATTAGTATNAAQLGGLPASAYVRNTAPLTFTFSPLNFRTDDPLVTLGLSSNGALDVGTTNFSANRDIFLALDVPIALFAIPLNLESVEICSFNGGGTGQPFITNTTLFDLLAIGSAQVATNSTDRQEGGCYSIEPVGTYTLLGALTLRLSMTFANTTQSFTFTRIKVTLRP